MSEDEDCGGFAFNVARNTAGLETDPCFNDDCKCGHSRKSHERAGHCEECKCIWYGEIT